MMSWLYYLLEANLYLLLFYGFYRLFLHKETFYSLNRYYLIFNSVLAFILPFFQLGFLKKEVVMNYTGFIQVQEQAPLFNTENVSLLLYSIVSLFFISKIVWGLRYIKKLMKGATKRKENGVTLIEVKNSKMAFSFFNLLFIDPAMSQINTVMKHEMVHIKQMHSLDILLFELIKISSWFNPITYFIKNDIKLIHEYLADEETTQKDIAKYEYALFLIQNSYGNHEVILTNQFFNSSILKNRISMLNQKKSTKWARLKLLLTLPLMGSMLCLSTMAFTKNYNTIQLGSEKESLVIVLQDTTKKKSDKKRLPPPPPVEPNHSKAKKFIEPKVEQVRFPPPIVKKDGKRLPPPVVIKDKKTRPVPPPPPPVEPKSQKRDNDNETVNEVPLTSSDKKNITAITVKGYPASSKKENTGIKTINISPVKEVIVTGYPSKKQ